MLIRSMLAALCAIATLATAAQAQDGVKGYPDKPIRLIVGFAAGGIADLGARLLGDHITRETGQAVVVENRSAAAGTVAVQAVAKAPPDGYTLGVVLSGQLVINPFVQKAFPLDALKDLVPVAAIGEAPQMIAINAGVPAKTLKEFVALAKAKPNTMSYASAGFGSLPHLSAAEFLRQAGVSLVHVPYKGNQPATTDLLGGQVQLLSSSIGGLRGGLEAGKIRLLLVGAKNCHPDIPGRADLGGSRPSRLPDDGVDRRGRAARHAAADRRPRARLDAGHAQGPDDGEAHGRRRDRRDADEPARVHRLREGRIRPLGKDREGRRRRAAIGVASTSARPVAKDFVLG